MRTIRVVSDGGYRDTRIFDSETGEDLTAKYPISDCKLELDDSGSWTATLEIIEVEVDVEAEAKEHTK